MIMIMYLLKFIFYLLNFDNFELMSFVFFLIKGFDIRFIERDFFVFIFYKCKFSFN
jgi:hypothetical protein